MNIEYGRLCFCDCPPHRLKIRVILTATNDHSKYLAVSTNKQFVVYFVYQQFSRSLPEFLTRILRFRHVTVTTWHMVYLWYGMLTKHTSLQKIITSNGYFRWCKMCPSFLKCSSTVPTFVDLRYLKSNMCHKSLNISARSTESNGQNIIIDKIVIYYSTQCT